MADLELDDEEDGIPWCWKYVALVIINPLVGGLILTFMWGALSLHWAESGWPAWRLGILSMAVLQLRAPAVQLLVSTGLWMTFLFVLVSFLVMLPSIFFPQEEWAVAVLVVCEAFETYVLYDSVSFVSFADTERMAQQASSQTLQYFTLASALAPTIGGSTYLVFGWQGVACLGAGAKFVQLLVLAMDETVQEQLIHVMLYLCRRQVDYDDDDDLFDDEEDFEVSEPAAGRKVSRRSDKKEATEAEMLPVLPGMPADPEPGGGALEEEAKRPRVGSGDSPAVSPADSPADKDSKRPSQRPSQRPSARGSPGRRTSRMSAHSKASGHTHHTSRTRGTHRTTSSKGTFATNITKMTAATFQSYALAQVDAPAGSLAQITLPLLDEPDEDGKTPPVKIPSYIKLPLLAIVSSSFAGMFALSISVMVASVVFQEQFGLNAAISGAIRSAGGVVAVIAMAVVPGFGSEEEVFDRNFAWKFLATVVFKPYKLSAIVALWSILSFGMAVPNVFVAATAQLFMGVTMALTNRAVSEMCLFFSLGDGAIFLKMQVRRSLSDAFGGGLACLVGPIIYESFGTQAPFLVGATLAFVVFVFYVVLFCVRVGWGKSLEDAEASRARRRGTVRKSQWKTKVKATIIEETEE